MLHNLDGAKLHYNYESIYRTHDELTASFIPRAKKKIVWVLSLICKLFLKRKNYEIVWLYKGKWYDNNEYDDMNYDIKVDILKSNQACATRSFATKKLQGLDNASKTR